MDGVKPFHLETDFNRPFTYGDNIEVEVSVLKVGRSSISFGYRVFKQGETEPRIVGHNVTVCLDMDSFKKLEIPEWFGSSLSDS